MQPKTYLLILCVLVGPYLLTIGYFAVTQQQPFAGDLTRIGGLREADYGWNEPQEAYAAEYNFQTAHSLRAYDRHFDIVVAGDSFSLLAYTSWVNALVEETGMSVLVLQVNATSVGEIIRHPMFQQSPPQYFIFQSAERRLYDRLEALDIPAGPIAALPTASANQHRVELKKQTLRRTSEFSSVEQRFSHAVHVAQVRLRCLLHHSQCKVVTHELAGDAPQLFSSRAQRHIALLAKDYNSRGKWDQRRPEALRRLERLNDYFAAAQGTRFLLVIFPDKLTVYADFFNTTGLGAVSLFPQIADRLKIPRLDLVFQKAVSEGQLDVYLPNDSHSGGWANRRAGRLVAEQLAINNPDPGPEKY